MFYRSVVVAIMATAVITPSPAAASAPGSQVLVFDAVATKAITAGPDAAHVGHEQIASGALRDAAGRRVGHFAFTCRWILILAGGDARERCAGSGRTAEGRLEFAGLTRSSLVTNAFAVTDGTGAYREARGTVTARSLSQRESLITVTITPRSGVVLRVADAPRPPVNARFLAQANRLCERASIQLAALPPFPLPNFDPLHPDPALLPKVGAFFTGRGDPRPILRTLDTRLRALGEPPADRPAWKRALDARTAAFAVIDRQDRAALADNVSAFVQTVNDTTQSSRELALTATVVGATRCVQ